MNETLHRSAYVDGIRPAHITAYAVPHDQRGFAAIRAGDHRLRALEGFECDKPEILRLGREQNGEPTYYPRRGQSDSQLREDQPLASQLDLLRTVDNHRYPAWIELRGRRVRLSVEAM